MNGKLRRVTATTGVVVSLVTGMIVGGGSASAQVDQGRYRVQALVYGVIPGDTLSARVAGDELTIYQYRGRPTHLKLRQRRNGAVVTGYPGDPLGQFGSRTELYRTGYGYRGVQYVLGVPMNDLILRKVR